MIKDERIEELVAMITGKKLIGDTGATTSISGTTYNFEESPAPHIGITFYANNSEYVTLAYAIELVDDRVSQNVALNSATVKAIAEFYHLIDKDIDYSKVSNRELKVMLLANDWEHIKGDIVYNVLFYLLTGRTQYVRTFREFNTVIDESSYIEHFIFLERKELAKYYRRNRSLLLFIKKTCSPVTRRRINQISRQSRKVNVPLKAKSKQGDLTAKPTIELEKMLGASDVITVRNGRKYKVEGRSKHPYDVNHILSILRSRHDVFTPEQLDLKKKGWIIAIPKSQKQGLGNIPNGSYFPIKGGDTLGIRWFKSDGEFSSTDLDLSLITKQDKYGWNGNKSGTYEYSGDMTHTEYDPVSERHVASESFTVNEINQFAKLDVSTFSQNDADRVELFIGDEIIPFERPANTSTLGFIKDGNFFVNYSEFGRGEVNVSSVGDLAEQFEESFYY